MLFMLTMECLSRLFRKASKHHAFEYHQHCNKMGLTHLMFADDLIIFCKAKPASLQLLMDAFQEFTRSSGLAANLEKSNIVFGGDCMNLQQECLNITGFTEGQLPFRYLGMPITASRLTNGEYNILAEKITTKIKVWASRHISYAGRLVLVNTVLFGMFNFWAQVFILPQDVVNQVMKLSLIHI